MPTDTGPTDVDKINSDAFKDESLPDFDDGAQSFVQFLEARGAKHLDTTTPEGQILQAQYLTSLENKDHPIDTLRRISVNPWAAPRDRISASRTLLEYTMIKMPSKVDFNNHNAAGSFKLDPAKLAALSQDEIEVLMGLLAKLGGE